MFFNTTDLKKWIIVNQFEIEQKLMFLPRKTIKAELN